MCRAMQQRHGGEGRTDRRPLQLNGNNAFLYLCCGAGKKDWTMGVFLKWTLQYLVMTELGGVRKREKVSVT